MNIILNQDQSLKIKKRIYFYEAVDLKAIDLKRDKTSNLKLFLGLAMSKKDVLSELKNRNKNCHNLNKRILIIKLKKEEILSFTLDKCEADKISVYSANIKGNVAFEITKEVSNFIVAMLNT